VTSNDRHVILWTFGQAVRERRHALGFTQEHLAQRAGVGRSYITDIELGLRNVALVTIVRLATALDMPASGLVAGVDTREQMK
jgi:transcriptional regulator with XRE-family HTH domain